VNIHDGRKSTVALRREAPAAILIPCLTKSKEHAFLNGLQDFLSLPCGEVEQLNLEAKEQRLSGTPVDKVQESRLKYPPMKSESRP
jgi:hypothetical protein